MIIGITGTNGAGKGTVGQYLAQKHGFNYFSARDVWNEEIARRGLVSDRNTMREVANDLRAQHGSHYFAEGALERAKRLGGNSIFESIRTVGEAQYLKSHGALLWAVDANRHARYERAILRGSETDKVSFEQFCEQEDREMQNTDPARQNISAVMMLADAVLTNNGTREELHEQVEQALAQAAR